MQHWYSITVPIQAPNDVDMTTLVCVSLLSAVQKYCKETAHVKLLRDGKVVTCDIVVDAPARLIPFHIKVWKVPSEFCGGGGGGTTQYTQ
jgi:hypothetical protein